MEDKFVIQQNYHLQFKEMQMGLSAENLKDHTANLMLRESHNIIHKKETQHRVKRTTDGYQICEI